MQMDFMQRLIYCGISVIKWTFIGFNIKWRFGLEIVKIARKGFEVLSKGEGQATARPRNLARVKKEVLAFSQNYSSHWSWGEESNLDTFEESDLTYTGSTHYKWYDQVTSSRRLCSRWKARWHDQHPQFIWRSSDGIAIQEINSSVTTLDLIWILSYRYAVLLRGMHHVDRWSYISAQTNPWEID